MKTLIQDSITIKGIGRNRANTIFNSTDKSDSRYYDISLLAGRKIYFKYSYTEDESTVEEEVAIELKSEGTEAQLKKQVIDTIKKLLK